MPDFPEDLFAILGTEFAPRTAVGISQDEESLILLAIDGRQPGFSIGATPYQTAEWLDRFGASQGLNLDGGGSTTMVREDEFGSPLVLNSPSDGSERFNGNNLGVFAKPIPEPLTILGTTIALAFGAMFKGKNTLNREAE